MFDNHTERTYRMVVQKIPSNLSNARYLFADYSVSFRYKSSTFALLTQENLSRERNPPTSRENTKEETVLNNVDFYKTGISSNCLQKSK